MEEKSGGLTQEYIRKRQNASKFLKDMCEATTLNLRSYT